MPDYTFGIGLRQTGDVIDLQQANQNGELGGIKLLGRSPVQGLALSPDGILTAPLATDVAAGTIVEPPADSKRYMRSRNTAGVSSWVENTAQDGLVPIGRSPLNGLDNGYDDVLKSKTIFVPLATDLLAGSIVEPLPDGQQYARTWDGTKGAWTPVVSGGIQIADAPPTGAAPNTLWWNSSTGDLFVNYQDVDSTAWIQINIAAPATTGIPEAPTDGVGYVRQSSAWSAITVTGATVGDVKAGFQPADHAGWIKLDGRAISTLAATQQAAAATLGFTTNLPDAENAVPLQSSTLGPLALGGIAGSMSRDIVLTQANLPAVNLTSSSGDAASATTSISGNHQHAAYGRTSDANSCTFYDWPEVGGQYRWNNAETHVGNKSADANYESTKYPLSAGGEHNHTVTLPAHTHTVALGGSGTAIQLDITPKAFAANYFVWLGP